MKLSQLYANNKFKNIKFNDGLNLVLAKVTKKTDLKKDSHNLGKTTLVSVIDFMLLKEIDKEHFFNKHIDKFSDYVFFLEIVLNNGSFLTIKRSIANKTKVSFKIHNQSLNLLTESKWDLTNIAFDKAIVKLNEYIMFDVIPNWSYRQSVSYFLRSQKDYNDVFQLSKFVKAVDWKPFMFDLLGFSGDLLKDKVKLENDNLEQNKLIESLKTKFSLDTDEIDKVKGAIELKKDEKKELEDQIQNFNFYTYERKINRELVDEIETEISQLNTLEYSLEYELSKINNSLDNKVNFDIDQLKLIYDEAKIVLSNEVIKEYRDLEEFNKSITEERNKYLIEQVQKIQDRLDKTRNKLKELNEQRNNYLSFLQDKETFHKFKKYQADISRLEGDISRLEEKLKNIDRVEIFKEEIGRTDKQIEIIAKSISTQINSNDNKLYPEIRKHFNNTFKYILGTYAILFIKQNSHGNLEFKTEVSKSNEDEITAEGQGHSYKKMLCICFDIAVLLCYHKKSFYRFVYHDGSMEGLDNRKKINYISIVRRFCDGYKMQYILSSIEDDIPKEVMDKIQPNEICLILDDSGDNGKLFEMSF
jgi:uncharacterized protein YydD (DUF2326 family)